jgi:hypothetical protein
MQPDDLHTALGRIPAEATTSDDRLAWTLDVAALALEHRRGDGARASFEAHERYFRERHGESSIAATLARLRDTRRRVHPRDPDPAQLDALHRVVEDLVAATQAEGAPYRRRVSYGVRAVNQVTLETRAGLRSFHLLHGSALAAPADVLVVPSHANAAREPEGQLVSALRWRWGMPVQDPGPLLRLAGGGWASWLPQTPAEAPFRGVLLLRTPSPSPSEDPIEAYGAQLRGAFAALRALAYLGVPVGRVTLSMIGGNRLPDTENRARTIIQEVARWLRAEEGAERVQAVVFYEEELNTWSIAMDRVLGRTWTGPGQDAVLDGLQKDVLARLDGTDSPALARSVSALRSALSRTDGQLAIHTVCAFGRALVEEMVGELQRRRGAKAHHELFRNIEALREAGVIAPWVASYMHGLRVLGNESIHERGSDVLYSPRTLGKADLAHGLAAIRALLEGWADGARSRQPS